MLLKRLKKSKILVTTRMVNESVALHSLKLAKNLGCLLILKTDKF